MNPAQAEVRAALGARPHERPAFAPRLRDLLRSAMEAEGFTVYESEWWHFDYKDWRRYRIQNTPFEQIR